MNPADFILWGIAVISFLGSATVFLKGSAEKATVNRLEKRVEVQDGLIDDQNEQIKTIERKSAEERAELQRQVAARDEKIKQQQEQIHSLGRQVNLLSNVVTNKSEVERLLAEGEHLQSTLDAHHTAAMERTTAILEVLEAIKAGVGQ